jgi:hypothetical protein
MREPRARVLFLVDGLHVLKTVAEVKTGGTSPLRIPLLAERLRRSQGESAVYSALVDASVARGVPAEVARFGGTALFPTLRRNLGSPGAHLAEPVSTTFDPAVADIRSFGPPGIEFTLRAPESARLVDAYVYLGGG